MITINADGMNDLFQWDINRSVVITGVDPSHEYQVHFKNLNMDSVIVKNATSYDTETVTARIPNELLQSEFPITLYIYGSIGDTVRTFTTADLKVIPRPKPSDYVLPDDEDEAFTYIKLKTELNALSDYIKTLITEISKTYATKEELANTGGGNSNITIDTDVDTFSSNPIANYAITRYVDSLISKIISGETTVGRSQNDFNGNNIVETYATKEALANGSFVVAEANVAQKAYNDFNGDLIEVKNLATKEELVTQIGDVETSLENIINKYGLGGEAL